MPSAVVTTTLIRTLALFGLLASSVIAPTTLAAEAPASRSVTTSASSAPRLALSETSVDFGTINQGRTVEREFELSNTGGDILRILDISSSCGCTTVGEWARVLGPGEKGRLSVRLDTAHFIGPIAKTVTIRTNDPAHQTTHIELKATVWTPISLSNSTIVFPAVIDPAQSATKTVTIRHEMDGPLTLTPPVSDNALFGVSLKTIAPGREFELVATTVPPLPDGTHTGRVTIKTSNSKMPEITVQLVATVLPPIQVAPTEISFTATRLTAPEKRYAVLLNHRKMHLEVTDLATNVPGVELTTTRSSDGSQFTITLAFPAGFESAAGTKYVLRGKTNQPSVPTFEIPIVFRGDR